MTCPRGPKKIRDENKMKTTDEEVMVVLIVWVMFAKRGRP